MISLVLGPFSMTPKEYFAPREKRQTGGPHYHRNDCQGLSQNRRVV